MISYRFIQEEDYQILEESLQNDEYHKGTPLSFFLEEGTVCTVYSEDNIPVLFVRGKPILHEGTGAIQLDIQFLNNKDSKRNIKVMLEGFYELEAKAKENGFVGFFFNSTVPKLKRFCIKYLGFEDYGDFLVKIFNKKGLDEVERGVV